MKVYRSSGPRYNGFLGLRVLTNHHHVLAHDMHVSNRDVHILRLRCTRWRNLESDGIATVKLSEQSLSDVPTGGPCTLTISSQSLVHNMGEEQLLFGGLPHTPTKLIFKIL